MTVGSAFFRSHLNVDTLFAVSRWVCSVSFSSYHIISHQSFCVFVVRELVLGDSRPSWEISWCLVKCEKMSDAKWGEEGGGSLVIDYDDMMGKIATRSSFSGVRAASNERSWCVWGTSKKMKHHHRLSHDKESHEWCLERGRQVKRWWGKVSHDNIRVDSKKHIKKPQQEQHCSVPENMHIRATWKHDITDDGSTFWWWSLLLSSYKSNIFSCIRVSVLSWFMIRMLWILHHPWWSYTPSPTLHAGLVCSLEGRIWGSLSRSSRICWSPSLRIHRLMHSFLEGSFRSRKHQTDTPSSSLVSKAVTDSLFLNWTDKQTSHRQDLSMYLERKTCSPWIKDHGWSCLELSHLDYSSQSIRVFDSQGYFSEEILLIMKFEKEIRRGGSSFATTDCLQRNCMSPCNQTLAVQYCFCEGRWGKTKEEDGVLSVSSMIHGAVLEESLIFSFLGSCLCACFTGFSKEKSGKSEFLAKASLLSYEIEIMSCLLMFTWVTACTENKTRELSHLDLKGLQHFAWGLRYERGHKRFVSFEIQYRFHHMLSNTPSQMDFFSPQTSLQHNNEK